MTKTLATAFGALLALTSAVSALTVTNKSGEEITIGLDAGDKEQVQKVAAGKSFNAESFCAEDGCGVTGPWGYSYMSQPGETLVFADGKLRGQGSATGASSGESGAAEPAAGKRTKRDRDND